MYIRLDVRMDRRKFRWYSGPILVTGCEIWGPHKVDCDGFVVLSGVTPCGRVASYLSEEPAFYTICPEDGGSLFLRNVSNYYYYYHYNYYFFVFSSSFVFFFFFWHYSSWRTLVSSKIAPPVFSPLLPVQFLTHMVCISSSTDSSHLNWGFSTCRVPSDLRTINSCILKRCLSHLNMPIFITIVSNCRFQWPRCLRRKSAATRLLRLRVRIPPGTWMSVSYECCVLSGRGLCDGLISRPEESYWLWCVVVCVIYKPHEWGGHSRRWAAASKKKKTVSSSSHSV